MEAIEHDPAYASFEDERTALIVREKELVFRRDTENKTSPEEAYQAAESDGFEPAYCQEQYDYAKAELDATKDELLKTRTRLALISPYVKQERMRRHEAVVSERKERDGYNEYRTTMFGYLERVAVALERLAANAKPKRRRRVK